MTPAAPNYDILARPYQSLEYLTLGRTLERTRLHYLPTLTHQQNAFVLGDGDGRFLSQLLAQNPTLQADAVDTSAAMLQLLRQRCEAATPTAATRLRTHQANGLTFTPPTPQKYDLVVTHFFLDCLTQPELDILVTRITPNLAPGALWLLSDFRIPTGSMRLPAKLFIRSLYLAFRIITGLRTTHLPDHATPLANAGLTRTAHHQLLAGVLSTELWQTPSS